MHDLRLTLLRDAVWERRKADPAKYRTWLADAGPALAIDNAGVKDPAHFPREAHVRRAARPRIASLLTGGPDAVSKEFGRATPPSV